MPFPTPTFTSWFPWSHIDGVAPIDIAASLRQVGCYLLARFDAAPPTGPANPADPNVFYIGETHGNTTSLRGRLTSFGNSAGFYGGQWWGHYAARRYPVVFEQDVLGPGEEGAGKSCTSEHVFIALCAWQGGMNPAFRGIFPSFVEQQAIWLHTEANGEIPALNSSGRVRVAQVEPLPTIPDTELDEALSRATEPAVAAAAVQAIAQRLAVGMGYTRTRSPAMSRYGGWNGAERRLGNEYLYIGWWDAAPGEVTLSVFRRNACLYDGLSAGTQADLGDQLQAFWDYWTQ